MTQPYISNQEAPFNPIFCMKIEKAIAEYVARNPGSRYSRTEVQFCARCLNGGTELRYYPDSSNAEAYVTFRTEDRPNCAHIGIGNLSTLEVINPDNIDVDRLVEVINDDDSSLGGRHGLPDMQLHATAS